jgi:acetyl coenzyme A synthetase (ADP forming)-like protein
MPISGNHPDLPLHDEDTRVASLGPFFHPAAVAVVGASRNPSSIGHRLLDTLVQGGFSGPIYPVNPKASEIRGLRAYPSVRELPEPVDLALIAVPRDAVLDVVDDCAIRGVPALVVITAGFAEVGVEGQELQRRLVEKVRAHGMRLIGPNCLGLVSNGPETRLDATFVPVFPPSGRVAMSSDSGALGLVVLAVAARLGLGVSHCVSVGNRADVSSNDLLAFEEQEDATDVILLYLESFGNPRRFARIARRVSRRKPIVAMKAGRTRSGCRAAGSHTAALAASDVAVDALFHQTGVIRAETLEELFDLAVALESQPLPAGRRVGLLTNAGGPAILCADACEAVGLQVPELSANTRARLAAFLPTTASLGNPVDMIASATPEDFARATQILLGSNEVDALIVISVSPGVWGLGALTQAVQESVAAARGTGAAQQPVLVCLMPEQTGPGLAGSGKARLPCYAFPEAAARVLGRMAAYAEWRAQPQGMIPDFADIDFLTVRAVCRDALNRRGGGRSAAPGRRRVAHILADTHADLAVGKGPDLGGHERQLQLAGQGLGQAGVGVASDELYRTSRGSCHRVFLHSHQAASAHLDLVAQDRHPGLQHHISSELLRVPGVDPAAQDHTPLQDHHPELVDLPAQPALDARFQFGSPIGGGEVDAWLGSRIVHGRISKESRFPHRGDCAIYASSLRAAAGTGSSAVGSWRWGIFTVSTGQGACRRTCSATLPISSRPSPVRPCVPITIRSQQSSWATRRISAEGSPSVKR